MTQPTFRRGLEPGFVETLNALYDRPHSWWRTLVDDKEVFLAVRDNYVNVYHLGCSLLKLKPKLGGIDLVGEVHYKYLLAPRLATSDYIRIVDGRPDSLPPIEQVFTQNLADIDALKTAAKPYAGVEKSGVHDIVHSNWNVVDVEVAFSVGSDKLEKSAPRVDFAALQRRNRHVEIVFFEAKEFANSELRKSANADPEVVKQIEKYSGLLRNNHDKVVDSYRQVCCNLLNLRGLAERHPRRHEMLKGIVSGSTALTVDVEPWLVIFGFDADQRDGKHWRPHRDKLVDRLGGRVLFRGSAKGFTGGIST